MTTPTPSACEQVWLGGVMLGYCVGVLAGLAFAKFVNWCSR